MVLFTSTLLWCYLFIESLLPCRILVDIVFVVVTHLTYTLMHMLVPPTAVYYHHAVHNNVPLLDLLIPAILVVEVNLTSEAVVDDVDVDVLYKMTNRILILVHDHDRVLFLYHWLFYRHLFWGIR